MAGTEIDTNREPWLLTQFSLERNELLQYCRYYLSLSLNLAIHFNVTPEQAILEL